jgi:hypothetical protein
VQAEPDDGQKVIEAIVVQQMTGVAVDRVRQRIKDGHSDVSFFVVSTTPHSDQRTHEAIEPVIMEVSHAEPAASIFPSEALAMNHLLLRLFRKAGLHLAIGRQPRGRPYYT